MINQKQSERELVLKKKMVYEQKSKDALQKTLMFSGLKIKDELDYRPVKIYDIDHIHELYTNNQNTKLPHIVLLHGFGGTSMTFIRFFKILKNYYRVHALDALGVGHSSKGVFRDNFTYDEARNYYVDAIQKWRIGVGIENFTLVGHSFGGYLAACYTEQYSDRVDRLIMLSPAGTTQKTSKQAEQQIKLRYQKDGIKGKVFGYFAQTIYNMKIRPSKALSTWVFGDKLINRIVDVRLKLKDKQREAWKTYLKDLAVRETASQVGFYIIFEWPLKTKHTIESMINRMNFQKPIEFYYGQYDWMDNLGAKRLAQTNDNVKFDRITSADHQLIFDNPEEICHFILLRRTTKQLSLVYQEQKDQNIRKQSQQYNDHSQAS